MKTKLWEKTEKTDPVIEKFTVGKDRELDLFLAPYDVKASIAHAKMLSKVGLLSGEESKSLVRELEHIGMLLRKHNFRIEEGVEDIHSQIELHLTRALGETGKKIHTGRSRNDQVLTAIKLFLKHELQEIRTEVLWMKELYRDLAKKFEGILMPGYTHFQVAMPSSFDLWLSAYAESLEDDLLLLDAVHQVCDKNPLGSAAGYGSSFPLDREFTTEELGFRTLNKSSVYAQMTRGKTERLAAVAIAGIAHTLSRFSYDVCLFLCQNFGFISFPEDVTTGSSIMPHKKNPDVFELVRARCNVLQSLPTQLAMLTNNLPSGYHRDMQLTKELILPAVEDIKECLRVLAHVLPKMEVNEHILEDEKYQYLFSVEEVNRLVKNGYSFRDAYHAVAQQISQGIYQPSRALDHTHAGSIGNSL